MQELKDLLYGVNILSVKGNTQVNANHITFDSREAKEDSIFFAIVGAVNDGHKYIPQVIENGCKIIIASEEIETPEDCHFILVKDTHSALAIVASNFYNNPSEELKLIGITGTNGKTTIATLLYQLFTNMGYQTGLLSTVVNKICDRDIPSTHTTPDPIQLNALLREMSDEGCSHCFMEVSSHAIDQKRTEGLAFNGGVFTNITHDHLDYHNTFKEYLTVKKTFFDSLGKNAFAITNSDDRNGMVMLQNTDANKVTYAMKSMADYKVKVIENQFSGLVLTIDNQEIWTKLIGDFNAYNLLAVYAVTQELEIDKTEALVGISQLDSVEGRFQYLRSDGGITAIVDYAHTPDALKNVLKTIENIRTKNETVYTVVGCGGDRDREKRPKMAEIACDLSDKVILTSDNPRSEDPDEIIEEMMTGVDGVNFKKTLSISDRKQAIKNGHFDG